MVFSKQYSQFRWMINYYILQWLVFDLMCVLLKTRVWYASKDTFQITDYTRFYENVHNFGMFINANFAATNSCC